MWTFQTKEAFSLCIRPSERSLSVFLDVADLYLVLLVVEFCLHSEMQQWADKGTVTKWVASPQQSVHSHTVCLSYSRTFSSHWLSSESLKTSHNVWVLKAKQKDYFFSRVTWLVANPQPLVSINKQQLKCEKLTSYLILTVLDLIVPYFFNSFQFILSIQ